MDRVVNYYHYSVYKLLFVNLTRRFENRLPKKNSVGYCV